MGMSSTSAKSPKWSNLTTVSTSSTLSSVSLCHLPLLKAGETCRTWNVFKFMTPFLFGPPDAVDRLQQMAIADLAFTNAKKKHDVDGQVAALIYRALERNTEEDGARSALCTSMEAVNPEIAALQQMQDPASSGAALHNQAVILELSEQIGIVGGDPLKSLDAVSAHIDDTPRNRHCSENDCIYFNDRLQFAVSNDGMTRYVVSCVATTTIIITATLPNPGPTTSVQNGLGNNNEYINNNTTNTNSPRTSPYTPLPTVIPVLSTPTITSSTPTPTPTPSGVDKGLQTLSRQRAHSHARSEYPLRRSMPDCRWGEWGFRHSLQCPGQVLRQPS